jgi:hypothetical protein
MDKHLELLVKLMRASHKYPGNLDDVDGPTRKPRAVEAL